MGKYDAQLKKMLAAFEKHKKTYEQHKSAFENTVEAANKFVTAHSKAASKMAKTYSDLLDVSEQAGRVVAEMSVYEDEMAAADKAKDKAKSKQMKKNITPLEKQLDGLRKQTHQLLSEYNKEKDALFTLAQAISTHAQ